MATSYYICKRNAKDEYDEIKKYWEEEFVDKARKMIIDKCDSINGEYINKDYAKDTLLPDYHVLPYFFPDCDIPTESEIGQFSSVKQCFDYCLKYGEVRIRSKGELVRFLQKNPDYCIYDESGEEFTFEQFLKVTKQA